MQETGRKFRQVRSAYRALDLLELLTAHRDGLSFSRIMEELALPRSTTHDLLKTLVSRRYLEFREDRKLYHLGTRMLGVSADHIENTELVRLCRPELARLVERFGETAHVAVLDGAEALYIAAEESDKTLRMMSPVGSRVPLHATAVGKVLLAGLRDEDADLLLGPGPFPEYTPVTIRMSRDLAMEIKEVRRLGYGLDTEEFAGALTCIAAPLRDRSGQVVAALGQSIPTGRLDPVMIRRVSRAVQESAARVYGHKPGPVVFRAAGPSLRIGFSIAQGFLGFHRELARAQVQVMPLAERLQSQFNAEVVWANARDSELKQAADVEQFTRMKVDAIIIQPVSHAAADVAFRDAAAAGIPAVCFQRPARSRPVRVFVGGDTFSQGVMQVEYVARMLGGNGKLVLIEGDPYQENARNMALGALTALQRYRGMELIFNQSVKNWSAAEGAQLLDELFDSGRRPDAIIAANDDMAGSMADVLARRDLTGKILLVGGDGDRDAMRRIKAGTQHATVFQDPYRLAEEAILLAGDLARGRWSPDTLERRQILRSPPGPDMLVRDVPYLLVSRENLSVLEQFWGE